MRQQVTDKRSQPDFWDKAWAWAKGIGMAAGILVFMLVFSMLLENPIIAALLGVD